MKCLPQSRNNCYDATVLKTIRKYVVGYNIIFIRLLMSKMELIKRKKNFKSIA